MSIETKSIGVLVDELITTNIKCFLAQEAIRDDAGDAAVAKAARDAQTLNARRNALIRAIDARLGEADSVTPKTYAQE